MEKGERRCFVRVPFEYAAILKSQDAGIEGTIKNLGVAGAFINTPEKIEKDTEIEIEITLSNSQPSMSITLGAKVVRLEPDGIAVQFTEMSVGTLSRIFMEMEGKGVL